MKKEKRRLLSAVRATGFLSGAIKMLMALLMIAFILAAGAAQEAQAAVYSTGPKIGNTVGWDFNFPLGVTVDRISGNVYVVDTDNNRIQKLDSEGHILKIWGAPG